MLIVDSVLLTYSPQPEEVASASAAGQEVPSYREVDPGGPLSFLPSHRRSSYFLARAELLTWGQWSKDLVLQLK